MHIVKNTKARTVILMLLGSLSVGIAVVGAARVVASGPRPSAGPDRGTLLDFAATQGIAVHEAKQAFADTREILDFQQRWSEDPRFGAVSG